jgi:hypothetical protein
MQLRRARLVALATVLFLLHPAPPSSDAQTGALICDAEMPLPQVPRDAKLCAELAPVIRDPSALPLGEYETKLGDFLRNFCHRDADAGWVRPPQPRRHRGRRLEARGRGERGGAGGVRPGAAERHLRRPGPRSAAQAAVSFAASSTAAGSPAAGSTVDSMPR